MINVVLISFLLDFLVVHYFHQAILNSHSVGRGRVGVGEPFENGPAVGQWGVRSRRGLLGPSEQHLMFAAFLSVCQAS